MSNLLPYFYTVWAVISTGLAIWATCHVVLTKRDNRSALGWVGIIWLTPFAGAVLYFWFGINRIHRKARRLMKYQEKPASPELANQTVGSSAKSEEAAKNRHVQTQADCSRPKTAAQWRSAAKAAARSSGASAFHDRNPEPHSRTDQAGKRTRISHV